MKTYLKLDDISAFKTASELADKVWKIVIAWDWFAKRTIGSQTADAFDSIAANIAEGFGRFHRKDKQKFYYNARGSVYEAAYWWQKAWKRGLISQEEFDDAMGKLRTLPRDINSLIKFTQEKLKQ